MRYRGKAEEVAQEIIDAFRTENIPQALATVFLNRGERPSAKWSWLNQLKAVLHGHPDARGFRQWQQVGRKVRKGQRAFRILGPCTRKATEADPERGIEVGDVVCYGFTAIPVFGYSQTEGEPLPGAEAAQQFLDRLPFLEVARAWNLDVETYSGERSPAAGVYAAGRRISLGVANLSTWAHELVHAADDRLGSNLHSYAGRPDAEIVAQFGAAVLLECVGETVASDRGRTFAYVESYAEETGRTVVGASSALLDRVCGCVELILKVAAEVSSGDRVARAA